MKVITGKFNSAKVFTDNVEATAEKQIQILCDQAFVAGSVIRIMPDCHAGAGCTIGTTMTIGDKVVPNMVGVDIGYGMLATELEEIIENTSATISVEKIIRPLYNYKASGD